MDEAELKRIIKALHEKQLMVEAVVAQEREKFESETIAPLMHEHEIAGRRMDELLGRSRSWIVGHYGADGMPVFANEQ